MTEQLNGRADAIRYGEYLANKASDKNVKVENYYEHLEKMKLKALEQSPKLGTLLTFCRGIRICIADT